MSLRRVNDNFAYTNRSAMRDQITLLMPSPDCASDGSPLPPVVFMTGVWAYIRALRSQEVNTADLIQSELFYDVRIPYVPGVNSQMTVLSPSGSTWFIVNAADPDQRQVEIWILCRSINDGAET
jgi:SPP1 family predicted phage head-tail adaptor